MDEYDLTYEERELLQRHWDGDVEEHDELERAERMLTDHSEARDFVEALGEVQRAASVAESVAWDLAEGSVPQPEHVVRASIAAAPPEGSTLDELIPLLERFHDGEVTEEEAEELATLVGEREDAMAYLRGLDTLKRGALASRDQMLEDVDFGEFWSTLSARITQEDVPKVVEFPGHEKATDERPAFDLDSNRVTLYRFFDGEADKEEQAHMAAWAELDPTVAQRLDALGELQFAVNVAVEAAQERQNLSRIWEGVADRLQGEFSEAPMNEEVISLSEEREKRGIFAAVRSHRSEFVVAMAAALIAV
ncbi:MAG: hypothetical protein AAGI01_16305, partial [Myxococcota bacterium]